MSNDVNTSDASAKPSVNVSIIIPAFNDQAGVEKCLRSIATQTYPLPLVEAIIVDNGSTPPLVVADEFPFRVQAIQCTKPGSYAARNAGARKATGHVLAFTDADCWPDKNWLANGIASLLGSEKPTIIGGEVTFECPRHPTAVAIYQCATGFGQARNVRDKGFTATANLLCLRKQFVATGPFEDRLLSGGDREWCWRAAVHGVGVRYEPSAIVSTLPRTSLRAAMQQSRRVAAGRKMLRRLGLTHIGNAVVAKQRSPFGALSWILSNRELDIWDRLRVLYAATLIRGAEFIETCRLALGGRPERR